MKDRVHAKPEPHKTPQLSWQRYNVLPLMAIVLAAIVTLGSIILYANLSDRPKLPKPERSPSLMVDPPLDTQPAGWSQERNDKGTSSLGDEPAGGEAQSPVRPPHKEKAVHPSQQDLEKMLKVFQAAYEAQDASALQRLSDVGQDRQIFLDMMADNYSVIKVSVKITSVQHDLATAALVHDTLVDKSGVRVDPDKILRTIPITIRRDGDHWGKVLW